MLIYIHLNPSFTWGKWDSVKPSNLTDIMKMKWKLVSHVRLFANAMDCSLPGSSVHGILQARVLEWISIPFPRGSSWPRDWTWFSCIAGIFFTVELLKNSSDMLHPVNSEARIQIPGVLDEDLTFCKISQMF